MPWPWIGLNQATASPTLTRRAGKRPSPAKSRHLLSAWWYVAIWATGSPLAASGYGGGSFAHAARNASKVRPGRASS